MRLLTAGAHAPGVYEVGTKPIHEAVTRLKLATIIGFGKALAPLVEQMYTDLRGRLAQPLQAVRSYTLYKRIYGPPFRGYGGRGVRIGTFSRRAPSVRGTAWESQVQQFPGAGKQVASFGSIRTLLSRWAYAVGERKVIAELGYPPEVHPTIGPYRYIGGVLLGTPMMQPRNFLATVLETYRIEFFKRTAREIRDVLDRFGRRYPLTAAQLQQGIDRDYAAIEARQQFLRAGLTQPTITTPGTRGRSGVQPGTNRTVTQSIRRLRRRIARAKAELGAQAERPTIQRDFDKFILAPLRRSRRRPRR